MVIAATGFFDGVHRGHRLVIDTLVKTARNTGGQSVLITFWPHPRTVLQDGARELRLLTSLQEKKDILSSLGVDRIEVLPFTKEFSRLSVEEYLRDYVMGRFGADSILLGYDNRMGSDGYSPQKVSETASELGLNVIRMDGLKDCEGVAVSSSRIRRTIAAGDMQAAEEMLGYSYSLHGVIVGGNRIGRTIGFPTANMQLYEPLKLLPSDGAYLVEVMIAGSHFFGMTNIGVRPTVDSGTHRTIETNIFNFDEDIYGLEMRISFIRKIRDEKRFSSLEELRSQLEKDRDFCVSQL